MISTSQIAILRTYRTYWQQVRPAFTVNYVNETLVSSRDSQTSHRSVRDAFRARSRRYRVCGAARYGLLGMLDDVPSLDEDRILRTFLHLIGVTVRTNAYKPGRNALSLKLRSSQVPDMPAPRPLRRSSCWGVRWRNPPRAGPVARGGIRWSDRREDYRTEVLGLLKAQITKNSMIVPTGAKGGFVLRRPPSDQAEMHGRWSRRTRRSSKAFST